MLTRMGGFKRSALAGLAVAALMLAASSLACAA